MELERYHQLRLYLQQWRATLSESIRQQIENSPFWLRRLRQMFEQEGVGEEFTIWLGRWCRQAAIQFILRMLFIRVLEDRDLLGTIRLRNSDGQQMWAQLTRNLGAASYVQYCFWDAAHLLPDLFGPNEYDLILPDDELVQRFLDNVWRRPDSNRDGWLLFDFRPEPEKGDAGFHTRFIGDLYQELDAEIRARYALLQTPHFISQFILEHTLLKRFAEKDFREVTLIDPTCGSGHFEVDAFWLFVAEYEKAADKGRSNLSSAERTEIARMIIEKHLYGCDINPYATALTRFRLILAACDYAQPASLRNFRDLQFNIVTIDSLIPYEKLMVSGLQAGTTLTQAMGQPEAIKKALPVLRKRYDVVVGNPPYIQPQDEFKRNLYRANFDSAYGKFGLSAPFTERFFHLAKPTGSIGLINSNSFARRQFGKKLIEEVLPKYELNAIIDLSGAYIPGHGTPTLIILGQNNPDSSSTDVKILSNIKGEPGTPSIPEKGKVWQSVLTGFKEDTGFYNKYIDVATIPQSTLSKHPWQFGGPASRLAERLSKGFKKLDAIAESIGITAFTLADEIYQMPVDFSRRRGITPQYLRRFIVGEHIRDWKIEGEIFAFFPYNADLTPFDIELHPAELAYLEPYKEILSNTYLFGGKTKVEAGLKWYEYGRLTTSKYQSKFAIPHAFIATHNHFTLTDGNELFNRSAQIVKLPNPDKSNYIFISAILNCSVTCLILKQLCYNKGSGEDPIRDRYELSATHIGRVPIPNSNSGNSSVRSDMLLLGKQIVNIAELSSSLQMAKLFEKGEEAYSYWNTQLDGYRPPHNDLLNPFNSLQSLNEQKDWAIALREDNQQRMIFLQEEIDWLAYEMYGLIKKAPMARDYLTPSQYEKARLQLGQRPFELAGNGYSGDWPPGYQPDPLPEELKALTEARIALIQSNKDIALLEEPLYKRRWIPPDYEQEFRDAAHWWLAEKLEYALEQYGKPISLRRWAREMSRDTRVMAALEVLTGSPMFDVEKELHRIIRANAAPNRPEHYLKPSGLRQVGVSGAEFTSNDFSDSTAWKLRGKLNIPRERFIAYTEFDRSQRGADTPDSGGPWYGWAGWGEAQRADALAQLLDQANRAGWQLHWQQCGLRAGLRQLLQQGKLDPLPAEEKLEFEGIAGMCGISLDTPCYCRAYREGIAQGEPGVPGVTAEILAVKVLSSEKKKGRTARRKDDNQADQLSLDI